MSFLKRTLYENLMCILCLLHDVVLFDYSTHFRCFKYFPTRDEEELGEVAVKDAI